VVSVVATALPTGANAHFAPEGQVFIAILPSGTSPQALGRIHPIAPGLLSAAIGDVPPAQTYLDISQGNRVDDELYTGPLPPLGTHGLMIRGWPRVVARADSAPADLAPGLLATTLKAHGKLIVASTKLGLPSLVAANRHGLLARAYTRPDVSRCFAFVCVRNVSLVQLGRLTASLRGNDLLIAIERPPPAPHQQLTIGIAGRGFHGNLTSDSTRLRGYVLSTDIAPTILRRLGVAVPSQMTGEPIRSEGSREVGAVASLGRRLATIIDRRGPVIAVSALIWIAVAALAALLSRGALARPALKMLALSGTYLPSMLLVGAALEPSLGVERLIVLLGAPLLAVATLVAFPGFRSLAVACAVTVLAFAIDVIAGSPLTPLSLIGPDPGLGVRFYGIGNELEAALIPMVLVGAGAALASWHPPPTARSCAVAFVAVAVVFAFVFGFGRFGADVGAVVDLAVGGAVAAAVVSGRRNLALLLGAPLAALAALALLDLVLGGNAHLTRSVLDAGGLHDLGDVAERRLRLSANSFSRGVDSAPLWLAALCIVLALWQRHRILGWFAGKPALRAGFLGAALAMLVATLANDSGALLLEVGTLYLLLFAGFAWAQAGMTPGGGESSSLDEGPKRHA